MRQKQAVCKHCGPVLAQTSDPTTFHERTQWGCGCLLGSLMTLGLALPYFLWKLHKRELERNIFRCQKCGGLVK